MSATTSRVSEDREFCPAVSRKGSRCDFAVHPGHVHWTWTDGWPRQWMALPGQEEVWQNQGPDEDPLRDAPEALIAPGSS